MHLDSLREEELPEFDVHAYIRHKQMQPIPGVENPEDARNNPFKNYMKELELDSAILTTQTFSVQAEREYQLELFHQREMQIAEAEE